MPASDTPIQIIARKIIEGTEVERSIEQALDECGVAEAFRAIDQLRKIIAEKSTAPEDWTCLYLTASIAREKLSKQR